MQSLGVVRTKATQCKPTKCTVSCPSLVVINHPWRFISFLKKSTRIPNLSYLIIGYLCIKDFYLWYIRSRQYPETHFQKWFLKIALNKVNIFLQMYQVYKHKACNYRAKITMLHRIKRKLLFKNKQFEPVTFSLFIHPSRYLLSIS